MANNRRRRRSRRKRGRKRGNWFTRLSGIQKFGVIFAGILVCLILSGVLYVMAKWDKVKTDDISSENIMINAEVQEEKNVDLGTGYTNIALFGVDSRGDGLEEGSRTDCIIVASLNNETKEIRMISVYRDTLLNLSDGTYQKCNAAYSFGGPTMAINMLNMNLDLDIQDYVTVDFGAVADTIDLLGGIEIDLKEEEIPYMEEFIYETSLYSAKEAIVPTAPGLQLMDGTQAVTYARIRSTEGGDFTRTERQRYVIEQMVNKIKQADLATINRIIDAVFPEIATSFSLPELLKYATAYSSYTLGGNSGFPMDLTTDTIPNKGSCVVPNTLETNVTKLHEFLFGVTGYVPSSQVSTNGAEISYLLNTSSSDTTTDTGTTTNDWSDSTNQNDYNVTQTPSDETTYQEPTTGDSGGYETPPAESADGSQGNGADNTETQ